MSGVFLKAGKAQADLPAGAAPVKKFQGIHVMGAEDPSAYSFNTIEEGVQGTRVPIAAKNKRGGIEGDPGNIYGTVVLGKKLTASADGDGWATLGDIEPPSPQKMPEVRRETKAIDPKAELDIQEILDKEAAAAQAQAAETHSSTTPAGHLHERSVPTQYPQGAPMQAAPVYAGPLVPQAMQAIAEIPEDTPKIAATFAGEFGKFRGNYLYVHQDGQMLILIYELGDPVYSPPKGNTEMTITCGGVEHTVYFLGVEFDLPFFDCGIQVFFKVD
jgi:hypothetical protein